MKVRGTVLGGRLPALLLASVLAICGVMYTTSPTYATTFTVTNTNDSGSGSLRAAITAANADASATAQSPHMIAFNIPGASVHTISITSSLPQMVRPVYVNGLSQPGSACGTLVPSLPATSNTPHNLKIEITGRNALPANTTGSTLSFGNGASGSILRGIVVNGNNSAGLGQVGTVATNMLIECMYIGTNADGTASASGVSPLGMNLSGNGAEVRNSLISGNRVHGIYRGAGATEVNDLKIHHNLIGTTVDGQGSVANGSSTGSTGVNFGKGSNNEVYNNVISGNYYGGTQGSGISYAEQTNLKIYGNHIGTSLDGMVAIPNYVGIESSTAHTSVAIGGTTNADRNVISGNAQEGIAYRTGTLKNASTTINGNYIGLAADGVTSLGNGGHGIGLQSTSNVKIGGISVFTDKGNTIAYNGGAGVRIFGTNSTMNSVRANPIYGNQGVGIDLGETVGVTDNDANDADSGANGLLNFPRQTILTGCDASIQAITRYHGLPNVTFAVDFYSNESGYDPTGYGEGQTYLSSGTFTTDSSGNAVVTTPAGTNISMVATSPSGSSSEFSNRRTLSATNCTIASKSTNDTTPSLAGTLTVSGFSPNVTVTVDGQTVSASRSGTAWSVADNSLAALDDGSYDVTLTVADAISGFSTTTTRLGALTVSSSQPTVSIARSAGQPAATNSNTASFTATFNRAIDDTSFVASDISLGVTSGVVSSLSKQSATVFEFVVTSMTNGDVVTATLPAGRVQDSQGNQNLASTGLGNTVQYDAVQPRDFAINADITSPGFSMDSPSITFASVDDESGIDRYEASVDAGPFAVVTSPFEPSLAPADGHRIVIRAYDKAGNYRQKSHAYPPSITIDAPTVLSNAPIADTTITINGPNTISIATVSIAGAGASGFSCGNLPRVLPFSCTGGSIASTGTLAVSAVTTDEVYVSNSQDYHIDMDAPSVTVQQELDQPDPTNDNAARFIIRFSEPIDAATFVIGDIGVAGTTGSITDFERLDGRTWRATVTGMTNGDVATVTLSASRVTDGAGNANTASTTTDNQVTYDTGRPSVTVNQALSQADPTHIDQAAFTVVFSEAVTGLTREAFGVAGQSGSVSEITQTDFVTWRAVVSGMTDGDTVSLSLAADAARDAAGNTNTASTTTDNQVTYDITAPIVTVNAKKVSTRRPSMSGTVNDPNAAIALTVHGATYTAVNGGSGTWSLAANVIASLPDGTYPVTVTATDLAGNVGIDATTDELVIDNAPLNVTINQAAGQADPTNGTEIRYTVVFSKAPTASEFTISDIVVSNSIGGAVVSDLQQVNATTWTAIVIGSQHDNRVTLTIPSARVTDALGIANTASTSTDNQVTFDTVAPTVTVSSVSTNQTSPGLSGTVNDALATIVVRVNGTDYAAGNGGGTWSLAVGTISPALVNGTYDIQVRATDRAGNVGHDATSDELTVLSSGIGVTINQKVGQIDPTRIAPIAFTVTFSRGINASTFTSDDLTVSGPAGTILDLTQESSTVWTAVATGMSADGVLSVALSAGQVADSLGNLNTASVSTDNQVTYDTTPPDVTVNQLITNRTSPRLAGTVSEPTAMLSVQVNGAEYAATNKGDGTWEVAAGAITPTLADGSYTLQVSVQDAAGNSAVQICTDMLTIDTAAPAAGGIDDVTTTGRSPALSGTVAEPGTTIHIIVNGQAYTVSHSGNGAWSLPAGVIASVPIGTHTVTMTVVDPAGNVSAIATATLVVEQDPEPAIPASAPPAASILQPTPAQGRTQVQPLSPQQPRPVTAPISDMPSGDKVILNTFSEFTDTTGKAMQMIPAQIVYFEVAIPAPTSSGAKTVKQRHSATVAAVATDYVDVIIASTPRTYRLHIGDVKRYDVTDDGKADIEVALRGIANGVADLRFKQLTASPAADTVVTPPAASHGYWWLIGLATPVLIGAWYVCRRANR